MKDLSYTVKLESYEGPLDLLLVLIKRKEVDVFEIPLILLINQYLEHLRICRALNFPVTSEFISMAAHLIYLKSFSLLPDTSRQPEGALPIDTPELEFIKQLVEYKKFKEASEALAYKLAYQEQLHPCNTALDDIDPPKVSVQVPSIHDLAIALGEVLEKLPSYEGADIKLTSDPYSITETVKELLEILQRDQTISFTKIFEATTSQEEIIHTFLSLLELIKTQQVYCKQESVCGEILVSLSSLSNLS